MPVPQYVTTCLPGAVGGQMGMLDTLELELQVIVRSPMWVLRTKPRSSADVYQYYKVLEDQLLTTMVQDVSLMNLRGSKSIF
ncbi:hypothetical protein ACRRTK_019874 [Alexandromys fortis]